MADDVQSIPQAPPTGHIGGEAYAEQMLFDRSPFGLWLTGLAIYLVLVAAYAIAARLDHLPWIVQRASGPVLETRTELALTLSLVLSVILTMQRFARVKDLQDAGAMARVLTPGEGWGPMPFSSVRLRIMTGVGVLVGLGIIAFLSASGVSTSANTGNGVSLWLAAVIILQSVLFFRGLELTRAGSVRTRRVIETSLKIDLLRIELLYPWGRAAARTALVWFTISAAVCLTFVSGGLTPYMAVVLLACAGMGVWVFLGTLSQVHRRIRDAKAAELEFLRAQIEALRPQVNTDAGAAVRLQGLLAYETRIAAVSDWPFDQTILVRVGASALILTVPWFGQAVAGLMVEHLGKVIH